MHPKDGEPSGSILAPQRLVAQKAYHDDPNYYPFSVCLIMATTTND
jgi:hypothetical protein